MRNKSNLKIFSKTCNQTPEVIRTSTNLDRVSADAAESVDDDVTAAPLRDVRGDLFRSDGKPEKTKANCLGQALLSHQGLAV